MKDNYSGKEKVRKFMEEVEKRSAQRKKKTTMIAIANIIWLIAVTYYVIFGMPIEVYVFGFLVFIAAVLFVVFWYKIDPIPDWDDL